MSNITVKFMHMTSPYEMVRFCTQTHSFMFHKVPCLSLLILYGTPNFTPFGEFMNSLIHYTEICIT